MARERQDTTIDGDRYEMTMLAATPGYRLFHRLFTKLGPSFGSLADAMMKAADKQKKKGGGEIDPLDVDLSSGEMSKVFETLAVNFRQDDLDHVVSLFKDQTHVGVGGVSETIPLKGVFEVHFSGRIGSLLRWVGWGLGVQYKDFSDVFANLKPPSGDGDNQEAAASQSQ